MHKDNNDYTTLKVLFKVPKTEIYHGRMDVVINRCRNKKILHLGCVDEGLTHERIANKEHLHMKLLQIASEVYGIDLSKNGLKILTENGVKNLHYGNVEKLDSLAHLKLQNFDIILATEIIEHLNNPGLFLESVKSLFSEKTVMILTTPNAFRLINLKYALKGYELIHGDHNFWYSWHSLLTLLQKFNYEIIEQATYTFTDLTPIHKKLLRCFNRGKHVNGKSNNSPKSSGKLNPLTTKPISMICAGFSALITKVLYKLNPFLSDGLIFVVKPKFNSND